MKHTDAEKSSCSYKCGLMPDCVPLAAARTPMQQGAQPRYSNDDALTRGTLFPGLDLPFMNSANSTNPYAGTPRGELMALCFAARELNLYLDTHPDDREAFELLRTVLRLKREGAEKYVKMYGPVRIEDLENAEGFTWLESPWPWEYEEERK